MTQTGKCDTCRQRKVKCDEEKPKCGACRKKDRPCSYSYGKASAFVVQDPNQLTKHGKSKTAPVIYSLESLSAESSPSISTPSDLHVTTEREAENGQGFFQTLAPLSRKRYSHSKKAEAYRKKKLAIHLQNLLAESAVTALKPSSPETSLIAKYIHLLGPNNIDLQPLSILGTWIQTIPSRIGHNQMVDLAVEFLVNSFAVYNDDTYSKRVIASASKEKALKQLQLVVLKANTQPTYDVLLATKMHYAAEALMGIDTMFHAIHAYGMAELLKGGYVANVDDEHFWNLIDNTYIDDVNEALLAGRSSVYDNEFYLASTYPPPLSYDAISLSPYQRGSMAVMHILIQLPRLNCLIRKAVTDLGDISDLVAAVSTAESLWQLDLDEQVAPLLETAVTAIPKPPYEGLEDIMTETLSFNSVQNSILCTRYWMLQSVLCGMIDTLHRHFPTETALSLLPDPEALYKKDLNAAIQCGQSLPWSDSISHRMPLVPLRLHTPLQMSIGPWHRTLRRLETIDPEYLALDPESEAQITNEISRARRMKEWLIDQCNLIHRQWDVSPVTEGPLLSALDAVAGEKIPEWLPVRVRFDAEDGEMVMRLDYQNQSGTYAQSFDISDNPPRSTLDQDDSFQRLKAEMDSAYGADVGGFPLPKESVSSNTEGAADFGTLRLEGQKIKYPVRTLPLMPRNKYVKPANKLPDFTDENIFKVPDRPSPSPSHASSSATNTTAISASTFTKAPGLIMTTKDAADFVHSTGRNLCSTSGWWPTSDESDTTRLLMDTTHKASLFSNLPRPQPQPQPQPSKRVWGGERVWNMTDGEGHPCLASSFWPQVGRNGPAAGQERSVDRGEMGFEGRANVGGDGAESGWGMNETTPSEMEEGGGM